MVRLIKLNILIFIYMLGNTTNLNLNDLNILTSDKFINNYKLNRDFNSFKISMINLNQIIETMNDTNELITDLKQNMISLMNWVNNYSAALENRHVVNNLKKITEILNIINNQQVAEPVITAPVITAPVTEQVITETAQVTEQVITAPVTEQVITETAQVAEPVITETNTAPVITETTQVAEPVIAETNTAPAQVAEPVIAETNTAPAQVAEPVIAETNTAPVITETNTKKKVIKVSPRRTNKN